MDVLLLEAKRFGEQSTGKSAAIVRCHYSNPEVVRMAVHSRETLRRLPLLLDCDPVYTRSGWLFLVDEENAGFAIENAEMQDEEGLDTVEVDDLQEYLPGVDETGIAYALYEPDAGLRRTGRHDERLHRRGAGRRRPRARGHARRGGRARRRPRPRRARRRGAARVRQPRARCRARGR